MNRDVLRWQEKMAAAAEKGDLEEALALNARMQAYRPKEKAFREDEKQLTEASSWQEKHESAISQIEKLEFDKAEENLASLKEEAAVFTEPFADWLSDSLQQADAALFLSKTREEMKEMTSVEQLGNKLSSLKDYKGKEAKTLAKEIRAKVEGISFEEASQQLSAGNMDGAEQVVAQGMKFIPKSEKLSALQADIEQKRLASQQAAQARREKQLKEAAAEEHRNQTEAAEVVSVTPVVDELGDLNIEGQVVNNGTAPISDIQVLLSVFEEEQYIGETSLQVLPYELSPGETGNFYDYYYGPYENVDVEVVEVNWYVN